MPRGEGEPTTPFIFIPYDRHDGVEDDGSRPFPPQAQVVLHECPNILVNSAPYNGEPLKPGVPYQLSARVSNLGGAYGTVTVRIYPSEPATGFNPLNLLDNPNDHPEPFPLQVGERKHESPPQTFIPKFGQPTHLCLYVEATTAFDPASGSGDVVNDRHYAQRNLILEQVQRNQRLVIPFLAVGTAQPNRFLMTVRQVFRGSDDQRASRLALAEGAIQLLDAEHGGDPLSELRLELRRWEPRRLQAVVTIPEDAAPGASARVVIEQTPLSGERASPTGSIGVVLSVRDGNQPDGP